MNKTLRRALALSKRHSEWFTTTNQTKQPEPEVKDDEKKQKSNVQ